MRVSPRIPFIFILTAFVVMPSAAHATECLSSAGAVWAAHPGSHATWRLRLPGHEGTKCWFVSSSKSAAMHAGDSRDAAPGIKPVSAIALPRPRPRSQNTLAATERTPLPTAAKPTPMGEARSILIWGTPMYIDASWDSLFEGRERIGATFARK